MRKAEQSLASHLDLIAQITAEISEPSLRTCTDAERPPRPLLINGLVLALL